MRRTTLGLGKALGGQKVTVGEPSLGSLLRPRKNVSPLSSPLGGMRFQLASACGETSRYAFSLSSRRLASR
jgi:hypothetical protein